jgi:N-acetylated-alpha-linked acidic dipeptidase
LLEDFDKIFEITQLFYKDEIYFVNYCREEDFQVLTKTGYNLTNKLVLCKYGKIFRGNKVEFAQNYNASGVLIYDDPKRGAPKVALNRVYPSGEFLPNDGVQRGSIIVRDGDPLTPNYPSTGKPVNLI